MAIPLRKLHTLTREQEGLLVKVESLIDSEIGKLPYAVIGKVYEIQLEYPKLKLTDTLLAILRERYRAAKWEFRMFFSKKLGKYVVRINAPLPKNARSARKS